MRIALLALGSRGDVQPFLALGTELKSRGHTVRVGAPAYLGSLVAEAGHDFWPLPGDPPDQVLTDPQVIAALRKSSSFGALARAVPRPTGDELAHTVKEILAAGEDCDLVVNTMLTRPAAYARPGPRWCTTSWWPATATRELPALGLPGLPLGGVYRKLTHELVARMEWRWVRLTVNAYRSRQGLPPVGTRSPHRELGRQRPHLYPISPAVFARPRDWPDRAQLTGFWFWDQPWQPPQRLRSFVAAGKRPVVVSFSSFWPMHDNEPTLPAVIAAARRNGHPVVVVGGPEADFGDDVLRVSAVSDAWLHPRAAAVVHHGGSGTTASAFRAGVPQVAVPVVADQPFWAAQALRNGVAAPPVPYSKLSAEAIGSAVDRAVTDRAIRDRAARIGEAVRAEHGLERGCEVLEQWAGV